MDFDEYEYLEKTVETTEPQKAKEDGNGGIDSVKSEERNRSRSSKHKREERADDYDNDHRRSKRSNSREESSRDLDRHKERNSRNGEKDRHRSSREHRDKDRDREERNGRDRERERERDRKERDRESERDRDREKERERSKRSQSRSEREQERSRDMEFSERESRERDRESRRNKDKKENAAEAEADPERDQRTVFAYQISLKASERDVYEFFSRAGKVRDVRLIMDRNSRRSKGVGYIEFYDVMSVPMAIALSGQPLLGQPVMVKPSEAEKNLVQSTTSVAAGQTGPYSGGARRLYVGNLHFNITEDQLRQVFEPFGSVELVQLPLDETGHCKGFGFVQFARLEDAKNALNLNGQLEIGGRVIKVSTVTDQGLLQDVETNAADLDDDEGGGLSLNSSSRASLMAKLDRSGTASSITGSVGIAGNSTGLTATTATILGAAPAVPSLVPPTLQAHVRTISGLPGVGLQLPTNGIPTIDTIGTPSECLLLKNMFDPDLETEPDFDLDIKEDVQEECSKFGKLKHIYVDRDSAGFVYLRFEDTQAAMSAQRNLHGRWFAAKMITATFMVPQTYEAKFPDSKRLLE
ncbi:RNA-binding protein 39 isoform X1 [Herrania umbratica]|uniref:RNA-binding protein 39 isoform X1 n=1 Tax=Herrania umbratica TaxID=108875 RepID=A0A6J1AFB9_9ROSI|nr:RNA-binding protein 39 isoform X1 [Herrania umbratica]XP_021285893.1 RNA-binding protein 39 isoform X1 [Herrania umbratica]XP_021285894.1 RNA-binding protein 39 isoform X1 [Herrania umbratica]